MLVAAGLGLALLVALVWGTWRWRAPLPREHGTLRVRGALRPLTLERRERGAVRVVAESQHDALFGLGFAHAQDRLFQMDLLRRLAAGRLSELFGTAALGADRSARRRQTARAAHRALARLSDDERALLTAYAAGVAAAVQATRALPPEYAILRAEFEPWTPVDTLLALESIQERLTDSSGELIRWRIAGRVGIRAASFLMDGRLPDDAVILAVAGGAADDPEEWAARLEAEAVDLGLPVTLAEARRVEAPSEPRQARAVREDGTRWGLGARAGSNSWVVDGRRAAGGAPLLANDTHLGVETPGIFHVDELEWPGHLVSGVSIPGLPGIVIGRNRRLAWGVTVLAADTVDYAVERVDAANPDWYAAPDAAGGRLRFEAASEVIVVRGAPAVEETIRGTRHGPVVDEDWRPGEVLVRRLMDSDTGNEVAALLGQMTATNFDQFRAAAGRYGLPAQNLLYADVDGHIGYVAAGDLARRGARTGLLPAAGWRWPEIVAGWDERSDRPEALDPEPGFIVTANNRVVDDRRADAWNRSWILADRAARAAEVLGALERHDLAAFRSLQGDVTSRTTAHVMQRLRRLRDSGAWGAAADSEAGRAWALLDAWDRRFAAGPGPGLYVLLWSELLRRAFGDEVGDDAPACDAGLLRLLGILRSIEAVDLEALTHDWWDDRSTPEVTERFADQVVSSLAAAWRDMATRAGADPQRWHWPDLHRLPARHPLGGVPLLGSLLNGPQTPTPGMSDCLLATGCRPGQSFDVVFAPAMRLLIDLAPKGETRVVLPLGQSGVPASRHYADQAAAWGRLEDYPLGGASTPASARLVLEPGS